MTIGRNLLTRGREKWPALVPLAESTNVGVVNRGCGHDGDLPVSDWTLSASFEYSHADSISRKSKHREALAFITDEQVLYR